MAEGFDADYLYKLAGDKSAEGRATLAEIISDLFDKKATVLSDRERMLMFGIMHGLIHEVEISVRKNFSMMLAALPDVPQALLADLVNDEIEVAYPLLVNSSVLQDAELINVIRLRTHEHLLAISLREGVGENVTDVLIETGNQGAIESLLKNPSARISESAMEYLVEQSQRVDSYHEPLLHRHELKEDLAKRMFMWVSEALRQHVIERYQLDDQDVGLLLEEAARQGFEDTVGAHRRNAHNAKTLASAMKGNSEKATNGLVAALADGEVPLFLALLAELTELEVSLASQMVFEEGGEGLAIACKAIEVADAQFNVIFSMSRQARPNSAKRIKKDTPKIMALYRRIQPEDAEKVLAQWRRGSDFFAAMEVVEKNG